MKEYLISTVNDAFDSFEEKVSYWWSHEGIQAVRDYRFLFILLIAAILFFVVFSWARKHLPSKGRIIDMYDEDGNKKTEKIFEPKKKPAVAPEDVELHDLPPEYYERKKKKK